MAEQEAHILHAAGSTPAFATKLGKSAILPTPLEVPSDTSKRLN